MNNIYANKKAEEMHHHGVGYFMMTIVAVAYVCIGLLYLNIILYLEKIAFLGSKFLGLGWLSRASPISFTIGYTSICLWLTSAPGFVLDDGAPFIVAAGVVAWFLAIGGLAHTVSARREYPQTMNDIHAFIGSRLPERWISKYLHHQEDAYLIKIMLDVALFTIPGWLLLVFSTDRYLGLAAVLMSLGVYYGDMRFETVDHVDAHTKIFRQRQPARSRWLAIVFGSLNFILHYILPILCLRPPLFYKYQHVYNHHVENNGIRDSQGLIEFDRMSLSGYSLFCVKLLKTHGFPINLFLYFKRRGKERAVRGIVYSVAIWYIYLGALAYFSWPAALIIFAIRFWYAVPGSIMAFSWHALADSNDPQDIYANSVDMQTPDLPLSTGWHIEHHLRPGVHWSKLGSFAESNTANRKDKSSVTFENPDWFGFIYLRALLSKQPNILWHYVDKNQSNLNYETFSDLIYERTRPLSGYIPPPYHSRLDKCLTAFVLRWLVPS